MINSYRLHGGVTVQDYTCGRAVVKYSTEHSKYSVVIDGMQIRYPASEGVQGALFSKIVDIVTTVTDGIFTIKGGDFESFIDATTLIGRVDSKGVFSSDADEKTSFNVLRCLPREIREEEAREKVSILLGEEAVVWLAAYNRHGVALLHKGIFYFASPEDDELESPEMEDVVIEKGFIAARTYDQLTEFVVVDDKILINNEPAFGLR